MPKFENYCPEEIFTGLDGQTQAGKKGFRKPKGSSEAEKRGQLRPSWR